MTTAISMPIRAIEALDYIPVISTGKSLVDLFVKYAVFPFLSSETIINNGYYTLVDDTSLWRMIIVALPIIGNVTIAVVDFACSYLMTKEVILRTEGTMTPFYLILAPRKLIHDRSLAKTMVEKSGHALPLFGKGIREDKELKRATALTLSSELRETCKVILAQTIEQHLDTAKLALGTYVWAQFDLEFADDREIQAGFYAAVPWTIRDKANDKEFVMELLDANPLVANIYSYLPKKLQIDFEIMMRCRTYVPKEILERINLNDTTLAAYKQTVIRLIAEPESKFPRFSIMKSLLAFTNTLRSIDVDYHKRMETMSDRQLFEEYINKIIKPLFNDDELNQALSKYAELLKGDLE